MCPFLSSLNLQGRENVTKAHPIGWGWRKESLLPASQFQRGGVFILWITFNTTLACWTIAPTHYTCRATLLDSSTWHSAWHSIKTECALNAYLHWGPILNYEQIVKQVFLEMDSTCGLSAPWNITQWYKGTNCWYTQLGWISSNHAEWKKSI